MISSFNRNPKTMIYQFIRWRFKKCGLRDQPVKVEVEYHGGYTRIGMGDRYTLRMLATELWKLNRNDWEVSPNLAYQTRADGTVCHGTFDSAEKFRQTFPDGFANTPEKVLVGTPRGSAIRSPTDQGRLLQYFAWAGQEIQTGVAFSVNNFHIEYWYELVLERQPDDEDLSVYLLALQNLWFERLSDLPPQIASQVQAMNVVDYRFELRYVGNRLRIWFVPAHHSFSDWKPLIETPIPRDKWVTNEAFALSSPPSNGELNASAVFEGDLQERYHDPEVQGGKIALIAANSKTVRKPPNCLDRMTTRKQKQVAYNERVSQAEDEVSGINCDIADSLSGLNAAEAITIAINAGDSMKRGEAIPGGQFWQQEGRSMTAVNGVLEGMPNTRTSANLCAAVEAVAWKHAIESITPEGKRQSPRIVFYAADMPPIAEEFGEFMRNPSDLEDGKHIACAHIAEKIGEFEPLPNFCREDSDMVQSDPVLAAAVPHMLNTAAQVSVGSRDFVLEDGPDIMNSSDEDSPQDEHGEELTGMTPMALKPP
jgi:hypothetical protein